MGGISSREKVNRVAQNGGYVITKELGSGAFGNVYLAESKGGEEVAIKMCKAQADASQEAGILRDLLSPHIVELKKFYGVPIGKETIYALVMEYCPKGDLANYLKLHNGPIVEEKRLKWYRQLASGLKYIHGKEIAHRDIKPQNILMTSSLDLKLGDVGLAKAAYELSKPDSSFEQYYMNEFAGTKPYMAPEIYDCHYTLQSDVFSLGLVFVMIAEKPTPLMPLVLERYVLGQVLHVHRNKRSIQPTLLLDGTHENATDFENNLFDKMLRFDYKQRLRASEIEEHLNTPRLKGISLRKGEVHSSLGVCLCVCVAVVVVLIAVLVAVMFNWQ
jgi:serine/threonine protein kinase